MILIARGIEPGMHMGLFLGLISAILASVFASLNKRLIGHARPMQIAFFELSGVWIFISVLMI
jgi:drug/metabolite transporter (DMT)-like permease